MGEGGRERVGREDGRMGRGKKEYREVGERVGRWEKE